MAEPLPDASLDDVFCEMVTRYFNGPLLDGDLETLRHRLATDASARRYFVRVACLDGLLAERSLARERSTATLMAELGEDPSQGSLHDATVQAAIREEDIRASEEVDSQPAPWPVQTGPATSPAGMISPRLVIKITAAAVFLIAALVTVWVLTSSRKSGIVARVPTHLPGNPASTSQPAVAIVPTPSPPVAPIAPITPAAPAPTILAAEIRATWGTASPQLRTGNQIPDQALDLKSGWIRLQFPHGVSAVVEGPARFRVDSGSHVDLNLGRIAAHVPPPGRGFAVQSGACRVVDLGTEFGMLVNGRGQSQVQVFKGKVSLAPALPPTGGTAREILTVGEARLVDSQTHSCVPMVAKPAAFVHVEQFNRWLLPSKSPLAQLRVFDEQLSRDPALLLFYNFDDSTHDILGNRAVDTLGQYDLPPLGGHGPTPVQGRLPGISALNFDASKQQYLVLPTYPITPTGKLSCAVWVRARSYTPFGSILKTWGDTKAGAFHLGFARDTHQMEIELEGSLPGGPIVTDPDGFPLNQWVQIAFVSDGTTLRLYRDGRQVASGPSRMIAAHQPITTLAIGCKTGDDGMTSSSLAPGYWDGQIGEIALFDRVLSAQEILNMSKQGRQ